MGISVNNNADYGVKQIKTLEGIEAIRLRPGMYVGSVGPDGVRHITLEIISNSVDEYLNGHCTFCKVSVSKDNTILVRDNGRGVPFGKAEDGSEVLVNVYTKLHTGAKFDSNGKTGYNVSGTRHGTHYLAVFLGVDGSFRILAVFKSKARKEELYRFPLAF